MKHFIKFDSLQDASGFKLTDVPYLISINSGNNNYQNLHTNMPGKYISVSNSTASLATEPLTFKSHGATNLVIHKYGYTSISAPDLQYRIGYDGTWTDWDYSWGIQITDGTIIQFKGDNPNGFCQGADDFITFEFTGSGTMEAFGNIMSLIDDGACQETTIPNEMCFYSLFENCTTLISAPELPAEYLTENCYSYMFHWCTSLTTAPKLPAVNLYNSCYKAMFLGCTSLINAPELPADTLYNACYAFMFKDCTSLVNAPELPARVLSELCYYRLFMGCTSLITAPDLYAQNLVQNCYNQMFNGCTHLTTINCYAISGINTNQSTNIWVENVAASGTFTKLSSITWPTGDNGIPSGWAVQNV